MQKHLFPLAVVLLSAASIALPSLAATETAKSKTEKPAIVTSKPKAEKKNTAKEVPVKKAEKVEKKASPANRAEEIKRVEAYLNSLTTLQADFLQIAPSGEQSTGTFYLKRPGKMRWEYNPPTPILMIASDTQIIYYDSELEQVSHIPIGDTLASFLTRKNIQLDHKSINITSFEQTPGMLRLTLVEKEKPDAGALTLEFTDKPMQLSRMITRDSQKQVTTIAFENLRFGSKLKDELFIFRDPRKQRPR